MRTITFHDHNTVRAAFLEDRFVHMRLFLDRILKKCAEVLPAYRIYCDR